jgi:hypothetical protein
LAELGGFSRLLGLPGLSGGGLVRIIGLVGLIQLFVGLFGLTGLWGLLTSGLIGAEAVLPDELDPPEELPPLPAIAHIVKVIRTRKRILVFIKVNVESSKSSPSATENS